MDVRYVVPYLGTVPLIRTVQPVRFWAARSSIRSAEPEAQEFPGKSVVVVGATVMVVVTTMLLHTNRTASAATFRPASDLTNTPAPAVSAENTNVPSE